MASQGQMLLAESAPCDAFFVGLAFRLAGIRDFVDRVETGQEVIRYVKGNGQSADGLAHPAPVLVVLCSRSPGARDFSLLRSIRRQAKPVQSLVVMVTEEDAEDKAAKARAAGAVYCAMRPGNFQDLVAPAEVFRDRWVLPATMAGRVPQPRRRVRACA